MTASDKNQTPLQSAMTYTTIRIFKTKYPYPPIDHDPELDAAVQQFIQDRLNANILAANYAAFGIRQPLPPEPMRDVTHSADRSLPDSK